MRAWEEGGLQKGVGKGQLTATNMASPAALVFFHGRAESLAISSRGRARGLYQIGEGRAYGHI